MLGHRRVHVIHDAAAEAVEVVGAEPASPPGEGADEQAHENRFLDGVQHVVPVATRQRDEAPEQREVADDLAQREADRHVAHERHRRRAKHAHASQLRIFADVVGENVDAVAGRLQRLEQQPRRDRRAALLIERLWSDDEDAHRFYVPRLSARRMTGEPSV